MSARYMLPLLTTVWKNGIEVGKSACVAIEQIFLPIIVKRPWLLVGMPIILFESGDLKEYSQTRMVLESPVSHAG